MNKADIISAEGDAICTLTELNCLTPRGRYDVKFFTDFIDLHGKTFDYKIAYTHILRLFLLPHKDNRQMYFVVSFLQTFKPYDFSIISHKQKKKPGPVYNFFSSSIYWSKSFFQFKMALDPPIKQGQTRYPFLIVLFNNDDSVSIEVTFSE